MNAHTADYDAGRNDEHLHGSDMERAAERVCMQRVGCHDYRHGTDCPMYDWPRSIDTGRPL